MDKLLPLHSPARSVEFLPIVNIVLLSVTNNQTALVIWQHCFPFPKNIKPHLWNYLMGMLSFQAIISNSSEFELSAPVSGVVCKG